MKELSIEEKAKAYDKAIERANSLLSDNQLGNAWIYKLLPELKENEDIMIKKALIEHFRWNTKQILNEFSNKKVLAWLEKQSEKTEPVEDFDTEFEKQVSHLIASAINREHEYNKGYIKWVAQSLIEYAKREIEEQDIERKQLYVRFGDIPLNEKSKIYRGEEEIGYENGVSVYPAFELNGNIVLGLTLPITMTTLYTQQHLLEYDNRPCYLVNGDYIGKGTDGEPLIRNISIIKRLYDYRTKSSENQDNKDILENAVLDGNEDGLIAETIKYKNEKQDEQKLTKEHNVCDFCEDRYGCVNPCTTKLIDKQKSTDKIKPKFKVGDWIIKNDDSSINIDYSCCKITKVENGNYTIESIYGYKGYNTFEIFEKDYHLWTIQDAKDGDVLVKDIYPSGPSIYIFKEFVPQTFSMKVHCSINNKGQFFHNHDVYYYSYDATLYPATKEQRDLLFQKMQEAGYEWDAEKKELTKIEQTSANEIPYPETLEKAIDLYYYSYGNGEGEFEHLSLEKFRDIVHTFVSDYGQKPAVWTEEDEKFFKTALWHISNSISNGKSTDIHCDTTDWFKSLKDRLRAQKGE